MWPAADPPRDPGDIGRNGMPQDGPAVTDADFYLLEQSLDDDGRQLLRRVREFMEKSVQPVINHYWTREEFPYDLLPDFRRLGVAGLAEDHHSALAKVFCTVRMRETVGWARELLGGNGILLENNVGRFVADSEAIYSYEGTREINTLIVGRAITGLSAFV
jgi:alkylation response protein AidB-like acyl-CoA dehydrogenase